MVGGAQYKQNTTTIHALYTHPLYGEDTNTCTVHARNATHAKSMHSTVAHIRVRAHDRSTIGALYMHGALVPLIVVHACGFSCRALPVCLLSATIVLVLWCVVRRSRRSTHACTCWGSQKLLPTHAHAACVCCRSCSLCAVAGSATHAWFAQACRSSFRHKSRAQKQIRHRSRAQLQRKASSLLLQIGALAPQLNLHVDHMWSTIIPIIQVLTQT